MVLHFWGNPTAPKSRVEWWKQFLEPTVFIFKWDNHYIILCILQDLKERETGETSVSLTEMTVVNVRLLWFVHGWKKSLYLKRSFHCSEKKRKIHVPPHNRNHSEGANHTWLPLKWCPGGLYRAVGGRHCYFLQQKDTLPRGGSVFLLHVLSALFCPWRAQRSPRQGESKGHFVPAPGSRATEIFL